MRRHPLRATQSLRPGTPPDAVSLVQSYDSDLNPSRPAKSSSLSVSTDTGLPLELLDRLKAFPLFQNAPETFLLSIGKSLRPSIYQPAEEIIQEGEDAKAMYWLVRGSVRVTSRDGESTYAELKPGAFFGEIGILMDMPRTASIVSSIRSLVVRLNKEDLQKELPSYPEVERAIRDEALERLAIVQRKKRERGGLSVQNPPTVPTAEEGASVRPPIAPRKRSRDWMAGDVEMGDAGSLENGEVTSHKKRKSPSPVNAEGTPSGALGTSQLTVRQLLKELPLFSGLPSDILHFLGVNAQPASFPPFTEIVKQGSSGREVYFIIKGEVEVLTELSGSSDPPAATNGTAPVPPQNIRARLGSGQYFGEVTSLSLSPRRTATVRSVNAVDCLLITGEVLDELWRKCSPELRQVVETEAHRRLKASKKDDDVLMIDISGAVAGVHVISPDSDCLGKDSHTDDADWRKDLPTVKMEEPLDIGRTSPALTPNMEPVDPDPFFNENLDNMRAKSRRSSLAPTLPPVDGQMSPLIENRTPSPPAVRILPSSPLKPLPYKMSVSRSASPASGSPNSPSRLSPMTTRRPSLVRTASSLGPSRFPDKVLTQVFNHLDLLSVMRCRQVSMHWLHLIQNSPDVLQVLDLSLYNRFVTDEAVRDVLVPLVGNRPKEIDLSNCFHLTDEGFRLLVEACGDTVKVWKMKSVWDVTAGAVLALVDKAKGLEEIDLSNCRKVGDTLLARVVGWVVPEVKAGLPSIPPPPPHPLNGKRSNMKRHSMVPLAPSTDQAQPHPPPGTVIGASKLKRLKLSYCKHIQDRSMAHIAIHAADRLESLDLTRCTSISDAGFQSWSVYDFRHLRKLVLADCTYLSDQAIVGVVGGCRGLRELDLSFCCALSDTATEVLALGLPALRRLDMAFCGSAVSDNSLRCIGLHLLELRHLGVRGCVRVTGQGVEAVVEGCRYLEKFDVSQCKNLRPWLERGGIGKVNGPTMGRNIRFEIVADGSWRGGQRGP
jgi:F-box/leucine-rich repeat protein 7